MPFSTRDNAWQRGVGEGVGRKVMVKVESDDDRVVPWLSLGEAWRVCSLRRAHYSNIPLIKLLRYTRLLTTQ
jgi:hypothetical protein